MSLANLVTGLINMALFVLPIPLIAWLDRSKAVAAPNDTKTVG